MVQSIPFNFISPNTLVPGFFFEVQAANNTALQNFQTLLMGQILSTGTAGPTTINTSANTASGAVLTFASVPAGIVPGLVVEDLTHASVIPANTTVLSTSSTTVTMSASVTGAGVISADHIRFSYPTQPLLVTSVNQAVGLFGQGSQLANMIAAYRANDSFGTLYALPLLDDPAAVKATGTITVTGVATAAGTLHLYIAGIHIPVLVTTTMLNADIAVACVNAINATPNIPCVASGSTFPITLTANNAAATGNDIDIRVNYFGSLNDEFVPAGLVFSTSGMSGGTTNPSLTAPLASLGSIPFDVLAGPYSDSGSLASIVAFLNDSSGRWSPFGGQLFGHYFTVKNDTVANLGTAAAATNNQHVSIIGSHKAPTPPYALASAIAANASVSLRTDPGLPLNTLPLVGALAPALPDQFTISDRQTLLVDGVGTLRVAPGNQFVIDRIVTTFTLNSFGFADNSYQNVEELFCVAYSIKYASGILSSRFARAKLAHDGARVPVGSNIVTPSVVKGSVIAIYGDLCDQGVMDGGTFDRFAQNVAVQINATNPNMLDILMPITPVHQLDTVRIALQLVVA